VTDGQTNGRETFCQQMPRLTTLRRQQTLFLQMTNEVRLPLQLASPSHQGSAWNKTAD